MTILDKIVKDKHAEVALKKQLIPIRQLENSVLFERKTVSLGNNLRQSKTGIIAEYKRRSPSKSVINQNLNIQDVAKGYENAGVCGMSVLTDGKYFGGSLDDLIMARASCDLSLLRKEFVIDDYQILEAKAVRLSKIVKAELLGSPQIFILFSPRTQAEKKDLTGRKNLLAKVYYYK